jgi:hypothetical protein
MRTLAPAFAVLALTACSSSPSSHPPGTTEGMQTYSLTPFTIQPGDEQINCYYIPATGDEHYISKFVVDMNPGSHHLVVFRIDERQLNGALPPAGPTPCTQVEIPNGLDGMLPGSQQLHSELDLPDGVGMKIEKYHGLYFQSHYINATQAAITTQVTYSLSFVDASSVQQTAGMIFYSNYNLNIPVGMSTATETCHAPQDLNILTATGHMHMHGLTFDASVGGQSIYHTSNWDEPNGSIFPAPGMAVATGTPISWSCAYNNTTDGPLVFGNSASKNEMCILAAIYYPAPNDDTLFLCQ